MLHCLRELHCRTLAYIYRYMLSLKLVNRCAVSDNLHLIYFISSRSLPVDLNRHFLYFV